jgi:hypothetical protein
MLTYKNNVKNNAFMLSIGENMLYFTFRAKDSESD